VLAALNMALQQRKPGVIHHSDQGSQYTSLTFDERCRKMGVRPSMGSVGDRLRQRHGRELLRQPGVRTHRPAHWQTKTRRAWRSLPGLKAGTTRVGGTARSAKSRRRTSKKNISIRRSGLGYPPSAKAWPAPRRRWITRSTVHCNDWRIKPQTVRESGASPLRPLPV